MTTPSLAQSTTARTSKPLTTTLVLVFRSPRRDSLTVAHLAATHLAHIVLVYREPLTPDHLAATPPHWCLYTE